MKWITCYKTSFSNVFFGFEPARKVGVKQMRHEGLTTVVLPGHDKNRTQGFFIPPLSDWRPALTGDEEDQVAVARILCLSRSHETSARSKHWSTFQDPSNGEVDQRFVRGQCCAKDVSR